MKNQEMIVMGLAGVAVWMIWTSQKNKAGGTSSSVWAPMSGTGFTTGLSLNPFSFVPVPSLLQDDDMAGLEKLFPSLSSGGGTSGVSGSW